MPIIEIRTFIKAETAIVFDLARSIDLHQVSTKQTNERAIAGKTHGLIGLNEHVTWRAKHFGIYQNLTSKITEFDPPKLFVDVMITGAFHSFRHEHHFSEMNGGSLMVDIFKYRSPFGFLGKLADSLFLKNYMTTLLEKRNAVIKEVAESDQWRKILKPA